MGGKGRGKGRGGGRRQSPTPPPVVEETCAPDGSTQPEITQSIGINSETPETATAMSGETEPGAHGHDITMLAGGVAPATRESGRQHIIDTERGRRAILRIDEERERRTVCHQCRVEQQACTDVNQNEQARAVTESQIMTAGGPPVEAAHVPLSADDVAALKASESASMPSMDPEGTQVFYSVAHQQQQQQATHRLYGAAARPVESSSDTLDRAATAASTTRTGAADFDDDPHNNFAHHHQTSVEAADAGTVLHAAHAHRVISNSSANHQSTRKTNYGTMAGEQSGARGIGNRRYAGRAHYSNNAGGGSSRSGGPLADASRGQSPTTLHRCKVEEAEVHRSKLFFWPLVVAPPLSYDEQQEEAFYLPFRDTQFYCYSLEEEMSALRAITVEQAAEAAAKGTLCTPVTRDLTLPSARTAVPSHQSDVASSAKVLSAVHTSPSAAMPFEKRDGERKDCDGGDNTSFSSGISVQLTMDVNGGGYSNVQCGGGGHAHRYHVPQLRRLWATTVLRQCLLFTFSSAVAGAILMPTVVCGSLLDISTPSGHAYGFFSSRNRFGASAALSAVEIGVAGATLFAFTLASVSVAKSATRGLAPGQVAAPSAVIGFLLSPRLLLLLGVALSTAGANLLFYAGVASCPPVAVVAKILSGGGSSLAVAGLATMACAEVGIAAGMLVTLVVVLTAWLVSTAANFFILPLVVDSWVTATGALHGVTMMESTSLIFAAALALLMPSDVLRRAAMVNTPFFAPSALVRAANEVSPRFLLRALSFSMLCATLLCMAVCATPIMAQRGLDGGALELVSADPRHVVSFTFMAAICVWPFCLVPTSAAWVNRLLPNVVLTVGLAVLWLLYAMLDPPSTIGAGLAAAAGASTPTTNINDDGERVHEDATGSSYPGVAVTFTSSPSLLGRKSKRSHGSGGSSTPTSRTPATPSALSHMAAYALTPAVLATATGLVFAIVASSVVRSVANSGATLPIHPPHKRHQRRHGSEAKLAGRYSRNRHGNDSAEGIGYGNTGGAPVAGASEGSRLLSALSSSRSVSPASGYSTDGASGGGAIVAGHGSSGGGERHCGDDTTAGHRSPFYHDSSDNDDNDVGDHADGKSIRARFLFQRRGGPSAVLVLILILAFICSLVCTLSQAVISTLLSDLYHRPRNPISIAESVRLDVHQSLLWVVAGLTGLAAFFEVLSVAFVASLNVRHHRLEV